MEILLLLGGRDRYLENTCSLLQYSKAGNAGLQDKDLTHHRSWWAVTLRQGAGPPPTMLLAEIGNLYGARASTTVYR